MYYIYYSLFVAGDRRPVRVRGPEERQRKFFWLYKTRQMVYHMFKEEDVDVNEDVIEGVLYQEPETPYSSMIISSILIFGLGFLGGYLFRMYMVL